MKGRKGLSSLGALLILVLFPLSSKLWGYAAASQLWEDAASPLLGHADLWNSCQSI